MDPKSRGRRKYKGNKLNSNAHTENGEDYKYYKNYYKKYKYWHTYGPGRVGNAHGSSTNRPGSHLRRVQERTEILDTINYGVTDFTAPINRIKNKTNASNLVRMDDIPRTNQQKVRKYRAKKREKIDPKSVHLKEIHPNIYLGNLDYAKLNTGVSKYEYILNISGSSLPTYSYGWWGIRVNISNIFISEKCNYKSFEKKMLGFLDRLRLHMEKPVLVVCQKGDNRSVALIICYAILNGWTYEDARDYIDRVKEKVDPYWSTLSNNRFRRYLIAFQEKFLSRDI